MKPISMRDGPSASEFSTGSLFRRDGTSSEAAASAASAARLHDTHRKIWSALKEQPRTADEIARDLGLVLNTARARCSDLIKHGWAKRSGRRRATDAGRAADVLEACVKERPNT